MKKVFPLVILVMLAITFFRTISAETVEYAVSPATGDMTYIFIIAAAVALAGLIFIIILRSRKNNSDDE